MPASRFIVFACARTRGRSPRSFVRAKSTLTQDDKAIAFFVGAKLKASLPAYAQVLAKSQKLMAKSFFCTE
jgi:hypothetical protein